jgi:hypothetical protein
MKKYNCLVEGYVNRKFEAENAEEALNLACQWAPEERGPWAPGTSIEVRVFAEGDSDDSAEEEVGVPEPFKEITEAEWENTYGKSPRMFETFGNDRRQVEVADRAKVWTMVQGECGREIVLSGFLFDDPIGYFITPKPVAPNEWIEVKFEGRNRNLPARRAELPKSQWKRSSLYWEFLNFGLLY